METYWTAFVLTDYFTGSLTRTVPASLQPWEIPPLENGRIPIPRVESDGQTWDAIVSYCKRYVGVRRSTTL